MEKRIEKLKEFTFAVKRNIEPMYRTGSVERNKIDESNIVNTFAVLELTEKIEELIEILKAPKVEVVNTVVEKVEEKKEVAKPKVVK